MDSSGSLQAGEPGPPSGLLIITDVNGDGFPDLVESSGHGVAVFLNMSGSPPALTVVSGATFTQGPLAPGSFASAFGFHLAAQTFTASPAVSNLGGVTVSVQDSAGTARTASLTYVSPEQINFIVPAGTATGPATVILSSSESPSAPVSTAVNMKAVAPALFTVPAFYSAAAYSDLSIAAAYAIRVDPDGNQTFLPFFDSSGSLVPLDITQPGTFYVSLFGTGFDAAKTVSASIEGVPAVVTYAGPAPQMPGVDQINLLVPPSLVGKGIVFVSVAVQGLAADRVTFPIH